MPSKPHRSLCMYPLQEGWYDTEATEKLNKYISTRLEEARNANDPNWLSLSMIHLIEHPLVTQAITVEDGKKALQQQVPFKLPGCSCPSLCCGACSRVCTHRCVQDLLQRVQLLCATQPWFVKTLQNPLFTTYDHLLSLYNDYLRSVNRYGQHFDYGPAVEKVQVGRSGQLRTKIDPERGCAIYDEWPVSGLCPFCLPKEAFYKARRPKGSVSSNGGSRGFGGGGFGADQNPLR